MEGINDIFIQSTSGVPFIARCYGGNFCQTQPDHALVTGFFAAINSFKGELGQNELNKVAYDEIDLVFETIDDLMVVCNIDKDVDEVSFRKLAQTIQQSFVDKYGNDTDSLVGRTTYTEFIDWMDEQIGKGMADLKPLVKPRNGGILSKIKSWFV